MKNIILIFTLISGFIINSQEIAQFDVTTYLSDMDGGHSLSNPCDSDFTPVYNMYGDIELADNDLFIQKAILQVFGNIMNNGVIISPSEFNSHPLIHKECSSSEINLYPFSSDIQPSNIFDGDLSIYPNPVLRKWRVDSDTILNWELYRDLDGELIAWFTIINTDFSLGMSGLAVGTYTLKTFHSDGEIKTNVLTQVER